MRRPLYGAPFDGPATPLTQPDGTRPSIDHYQPPRCAAPSRWAFEHVGGHVCPGSSVDGGPLSHSMAP